MKRMILIMVVLIHQSPAQVLPSDVQRLIDQRDAAVEKVNETFVAELLKLKVKATDPKVKDQIDSLLSAQGNGGELTIKDDPIVGVWYFKVKVGPLRRYEFKADGTFTGVVTKGRISGKWVRDGKTITMFTSQDPELPWATITQKPNGSLNVGGFKHSEDEWEGRRADKW
jgi:hypothetical protein